ncbi:MAG: hypothetical protein M1324_02790 [Patescibacteria group bacterium]|nr:hypothetical protein [Patescibacteria group bacterium]
MYRIAMIMIGIISWMVCGICFVIVFPGNHWVMGFASFVGTFLIVRYGHNKTVHPLAICCGLIPLTVLCAAPWSSLQATDFLWIVASMFIGFFGGIKAEELVPILVIIK